LLNNLRLKHQIHVCHTNINMFAPYYQHQTQPIRVKAYSDMGHLELHSENHSQIDLKLYNSVMDNITTEYKTYNGCSFRFYHAKNPNQVKQYLVNGQAYLVDFSTLG
jgi:hypothetical protein